ncbi:MAG: HDIG domain-containing protein [Prevotellaceae bacterium]|jgi:uncharacterized protein|nr:HDIG domain-containing protein [Prevotellaceae bacterium]
MKPLEIIEKYYQKDSPLYKILVSHSESVAKKSLQIAENKRLNIDKNFVYEAAMLHDIGIFLTDAPSIHCFGTHNYIEHGILGADILRAENLPKHALVCERHTGTGLTEQDIISKQFPLPLRDMQPVSLEEQLICFADLFFAKTRLNEETPIEKVRKKVAVWGKNSMEKFEKWVEIFL